MRRLFRLILVLLAFISCIRSSAQTEWVDSLEIKLQQATTDTAKLEYLNMLIYAVINADPDKSLVYSDQYMDLALKTGDGDRIFEGQYSRCAVYFFKGDYIGSIRASYRGLALIDSFDLDDDYRARMYSNLAQCFDKINVYNYAANYLQMSYEVSKASGDSLHMGRTMVDIGQHYATLGQYEKAEEALLEAVAFSVGENPDALGFAFGTLKDVQLKLGKYTQSVASFRREMDYYLGMKREDRESAFYTLKILNEVQAEAPDSMDAVIFALETHGFETNYEPLLLRASKDLDASINQYGQSYIVNKFYRNRMQLSIWTNNYQGAVRDGKEAEKICDKYKLYNDKKKVYEMLEKAYYGLYEQHGQTAAGAQSLSKAYDYGKKVLDMVDTIFNAKETNSLIVSEIQIEQAKQEAATKAKVQQERLIAAEEKKAQQLVSYSLAGGLALMLAIAFLLFKSVRDKKRANAVITAQKEEVERQKDEVELQKEIVEEKNHEILDSISYAKRIQEAILPPTRLVKEWLPNSFVLYKPKDIVAGDFYWMENIDGLIIFAAADCTGHGVPGALVSVVCHNAMNRTVREFGITEPGKVLDSVRELVVEQFAKSEEEIKDGMDIALCTLDLRSGALKYAGANNPIWIFRKGISDIEQLEEIKATKQPIGKVDSPRAFESHEIQLNEGDTIFIFSDGYADQFGGEKGKKLKYKPFKRLLLDNLNKPMAEQRQLLDSSFEAWKGELEQVDDVCVIGVRV